MIGRGRPGEVQQFDESGHLFERKPRRTGGLQECAANAGTSLGLDSFQNPGKKVSGEVRRLWASLRSRPVTIPTYPSGWK
jgi:hypothetical protein